jgi:HAD superfamily hydrolase (TIGR01509 family)
VLWDFDGTLADTEPTWFAAEYALAAEHGKTWSDADAHSLVGLELIESGRYIRERMGLDLEPAEIVERLLDRVVADVTTGAIWRPGARSLLAALRAEGVPCALVTMSYVRLVDAALAQLPPDSFDVLVTGDEVRLGKPHPEAYLTAAERLGVDPAACVAIEDSPAGAASAEAAGAHVLVVPHAVDVPGGAGRTRVASLEQMGPDDIAGLVPRRPVPGQDVTES